MAKRRVVITGIGILSPLGNDLASSWDGIVNGRSGIGPITHFDATNFATRIAGEVKGFDASEWIAPKDVKKMDPFVHYGVAGGVMAIRDAGIDVRESDAERIGVAIGAGIGDGIAGNALIAGIARYGRSQVDLSERIEERRARMAEMEAAEAPDFDAIDAEEKALDWDQRIFTERQQSLTYVCETPVILEQRIFTLGRAIAGQLD